MSAPRLLLKPVDWKDIRVGDRIYGGPPGLTEHEWIPDIAGLQVTEVCQRTRGWYLERAGTGSLSNSDGSGWIPYRAHRAPQPVRTLERVQLVSRRDDHLRRRASAILTGNYTVASECDHRLAELGWVMSELGL